MKDIYGKCKNANNAIKQIRKGDMELVQRNANPFPKAEYLSGPGL